MQSRLQHLQNFNEEIYGRGPGLLIFHTHPQHRLGDSHQAPRNIDSYYFCIDIKQQCRMRCACSSSRYSLQVDIQAGQYAQGFHENFGCNMAPRPGPGSYVQKCWQLSQYLIVLN